MSDSLRGSFQYTQAVVTVYVAHIKRGAAVVIVCMVRETIGGSVVRGCVG